MATRRRKKTTAVKRLKEQADLECSRYFERARIQNLAKKLLTNL